MSHYGVTAASEITNCLLGADRLTVAKSCYDLHVAMLYGTVYFIVLLIYPSV